MTTATTNATDCKGEHINNGKTGAAMWDITTIKDRRYTVCAHHVGGSECHDDRPTCGQYCGELIDVTDLPQVIICCDQHAEKGA